MTETAARKVGGSCVFVCKGLRWACAIWDEDQWQAEGGDAAGGGHDGQEIAGGDVNKAQDTARGLQVVLLLLDAPSLFGEGCARSGSGGADDRVNVAMHVEWHPSSGPGAVCSSSCSLTAQVYRCVRVCVCVCACACVRVRVRVRVIVSACVSAPCTCHGHGFASRLGVCRGKRGEGCARYASSWLVQGEGLCKILGHPRELGCNTYRRVT